MAPACGHSAGAMRIGINGSALDIATHRTRGIGHYLMNLLPALLRLDPDSHYVILSATPVSVAFLGDAIPPNLRVCTPRLPSLSRKQLVREQLLYCARAARAELDLLFFPTHQNMPLLRFRRTLSVIFDVIPELFPDRYLTTPRMRLKARLRQLAARTARRIITCSACSQRDIGRLYGIAPHKVKMIPLAPAPAFQPHDRSAARRHIQQRFGISEPYLLYVGGFDYRKNLPVLLHAFRALKQDGEIPHRLVLAGTITLLQDFIDALRLAIELGLQRDVMFLDYVPEEDLPWLYSAADCLVFPSFYEGFGLPVLEAMAAGTPVITSNAASLLEVVGDAALTFDPKDEEALRAAIRQLLGDTVLREDLRGRGLARAQCFSWERTAKETLAVFRDVVEGRWAV